MTSFPYNSKYFQNLKVIDCHHAYPDKMGPEWQAPNTNMEAPNTNVEVPNTNVEQKTSSVEMKSEWEAEAPNINMEQKTSSDEMESEREAPNKNPEQKASSHSNGEHSTEVLIVICPLKTNQFHQRMMMH